MTLAMTMVPGIYSRNRFFGMYSDPEVRKARARSAVLRGAVQQLGLPTVDQAKMERAGAGSMLLSYSMRGLRFQRSLELTDAEAACVALLCERNGCRFFQASPGQKQLVESMLASLAPSQRAVMRR